MLRANIILPRRAFKYMPAFLAWTFFFGSLSIANAGTTGLPATDVVDVAMAKRVVAAAERKASEGAPSTIVVVDISGALVLAQRMDGAFPASAKIAQSKAETALAFRQSTSNLEAVANAGRPALLSSGYVVMQGGIPLVVGGRVVGAIGVSGGSKDQDEAVAEAGVAAFSR